MNEISTILLQVGSSATPCLPIYPKQTGHDHLDHLNKENHQPLVILCFTVLFRGRPLFNGSPFRSLYTFKWIHIGLIKPPPSLLTGSSCSSPYATLFLKIDLSHLSSKSIKKWAGANMTPGLISRYFFFFGERGTVPHKSDANRLWIL